MGQVLAILPFYQQGPFTTRDCSEQIKTKIAIIPAFRSEKNENYILFNEL
jgi:hypothetical protein